MTIKSYLICQHLFKDQRTLPFILHKSIETR